MAIYDSLKDAAKVLQEAGKIEQYRQILEVQEKLLEMQRSIMDLEEENRSLKNKLQIQASLVFENNTYWNESGENKKKDGPFCSGCWDSEKILIRTHPCGNPAYHQCPKCKTSVQIRRDANDDYRQPDDDLVFG